MEEREASRKGQLKSSQFQARWPPSQKASTETTGCINNHEEKSNGQLQSFTCPPPHIFRPPLLPLSLLPLNPPGQAWAPFSFNINITFKYNFIYIYFIVFYSYLLQK